MNRLYFLWFRICPRNEKGLSAAWYLAVLPALLAFVGLAVDTGIVLTHYRLGQVTVDGAAYAAATFLDGEAFEQTNDVILHPGDACSAAALYTADNGQGVVSITCAVSGNRVDIAGTVTAPTLFMRIFGVSQLTFYPNASAELKYGITEEGQ